MPAYRLITLGPSHYCEKARWALGRSRVPFEEEPQAPLLHMLAARKSGGGRSVPVLVTDSGTLGDSTDILELCDRHTSGALYGSGEQRRQALELEDHFDTKLGPHTRRVIYFHILDDDALMKALFTPGITRAQQLAFSGALPAIRGMMRRGMKVDSEGARRSRERVRAVFSEVDARMADGRRFLTGDQFTAADLTFAALAAPVLLPPEYGWPLPTEDQASGALRSEVRHFRDSAAGQLALRIYREERAHVLPIG